MADTAAFFAKKKKGGKKKSFKAFNANKIDAAAISSIVHVDAPAISSATTKTLDLPLSNGTENTIINNESVVQSSDKKSDEGWEEATINRVNVVSNKNSVTELLDMNALEERRREQDDVAERMRVEETRAALEAARIGMEKEAQRLKDEEEKKKQTSAAPVSSDGGDKSGKWVPVHLRGNPSAALGNSRMMMSKARGKSSIPDTGDEMDFPDLGSANAAIEAQKKAEKERKEKERQRATAKSSGIKNWGVSRPSIGGAPPVRKKLEIKSATKQSSPPAPPKVEPPTPTPTSEPVPPKVEKDPVSTPAASASAPAPAPALKKKKKKKKDLSTFKASA